MLMVGNYSREPLIHHYRFLCKSDFSFHVVKLVSTHIPTIASEFHDCLRSLSTWVQNILDVVRNIPVLSTPVTDCLASQAFLAALMIVLHNAAAFHRRVTQTFSRQVDKSCQIYVWGAWGTGTQKSANTR